MINDKNKDNRTEKAFSVPTIHDTPPKKPEPKSPPKKSEKNDGN